MNHDPQPVGVLTGDEQPERFPKLRLTSEFKDYSVDRVAAGPKISTWPSFIRGVLACTILQQSLALQSMTTQHTYALNELLDATDNHVELRNQIRSLQLFHRSSRARKRYSQEKAALLQQAPNHKKISLLGKPTFDTLKWIESEITIMQALRRSLLILRASSAASRLDQWKNHK
ncbi:unnamed protein product [Nesidiocoris tenuis]|uniref:Uncharacterized protein n=1 Tax=Nesidiocoris tenuis TaxID=355587 RepID=A0A6H5GB81_9HEMI|nr:unnamed protein product [Nesidiocoris tenuis]